MKLPPALPATGFLVFLLTEYPYDPFIFRWTPSLDSPPTLDLFLVRILQSTCRPPAVLSNVSHVYSHGLIFASIGWLPTCPSQHKCWHRLSASLKLASLADSRFHDSAPHPLSPHDIPHVFFVVLARHHTPAPVLFPLALPMSRPPQTLFSLFFPKISHLETCHSTPSSHTKSCTHKVSPDTIANIIPYLPPSTHPASVLPLSHITLTFFGPLPLPLYSEIPLGPISLSSMPSPFR